MEYISMRWRLLSVLMESLTWKRDFRLTIHFPVKLIKCSYLTSIINPTTQSSMSNVFVFEWLTFWLGQEYMVVCEKLKECAVHWRANSPTGAIDSFYFLDSASHLVTSLTCCLSCHIAVFLNDNLNYLKEILFERYY